MIVTNSIIGNKLHLSSIRGAKNESLATMRGFFYEGMYCVYIIHSEKLNRYYIGTTDEFERRLAEHNEQKYADSYSARGIPWKEFVVIEGLSSAQAREIEFHIKSMKSTTYIRNLKKYPEMIVKLEEKYPAANSSSEQSLSNLL